MPEFRFPATVVIDAPDEAKAQGALRWWADDAELADGGEATLRLAEGVPDEYVSCASVIDALRDAHRNDSAADAVEFVSILVGWIAEDDDELVAEEALADEQRDESEIDGLTCERCRMESASICECDVDIEYEARFTPEAWVNDQAIAVDAQGDPAWNVTEHVRNHSDYWRDMVGEERAYGDPSDDHAWTMGVLDRDDLLKNDPNAPEWVREWRGPFTIRVYRKGP